MIKYANQPSVLPRLASGINGTDTSLTVDNWTYDAAQTPGNFVIKIENEYIYVGSRTGNVLSSLTREYEAPGAADTHPADSVVRVVLTLAGLMDLLNQVELANLLDVDTSGQAPGKVLARNATDDGYEFVTGGGGGGGGGGSAVFSATPTADVTGIGSSYTAICSLDLDPGHYVLFAEASGSSSNTGTTYLQLTDGTTPVAGGYASNNSGYGHAISLVTEEIILTVPTTFTLQASRDSGGLTILKETDTNTRATGITAIMIGGSGGGGSEPFIFAREEQAQNTNGSNISANTWQTRVLNTLVSDGGGIASLASDQLTLPAGDYHGYARAVAYDVQNHQLRLRDVTNNVTLGEGISQLSQASGHDEDVGLMTFRFTLTGMTDIELQHNASNAGIFGVARNATTEIYAELVIWQENPPGVAGPVCLQQPLSADYTLAATNTDYNVTGLALTLDDGDWLIEIVAQVQNVGGVGSTLAIWFHDGTSDIAGLDISLLNGYTGTLTFATRVTVTGGPLTYQVKTRMNASSWTIFQNGVIKTSIPATRMLATRVVAA